MDVNNHVNLLQQNQNEWVSIFINKSEQSHCILFGQQSFLLKMYLTKAQTETKCTTMEVHVLNLQLAFLIDDFIQLS